MACKWLVRLASGLRGLRGLQVACAAYAAYEWLARLTRLTIRLTDVRKSNRLQNRRRIYAKMSDSALAIVRLCSGNWNQKYRVIVGRFLTVQNGKSWQGNREVITKPLLPSVTKVK